jgi:hypothetical protein
MNMRKPSPATRSEESSPIVWLYPNGTWKIWNFTPLPIWSWMLLPTAAQRQPRGYDYEATNTEIGRLELTRADIEMKLKKCKW